MTGRGALAAPQCGKPAGADWSVGEGARPPKAGKRLRTGASNPDDRSYNTLSMREDPAGQCVHRDRSDGCACECRDQPEEHGSAERIVEVRQRRTGQSRVEYLHRRNDYRREQHRRTDEEGCAPPTRRPRRRKRSIGRHVAAKPQAMQGDDTGEQSGDGDDEPARVVARNVVVACMRDQKVSNNVDRPVRNHGRGRGRGDYQCEERTRSAGHLMRAFGVARARPSAQMRRRTSR
jgi:hypothetical protein